MSKYPAKEAYKVQREADSYDRERFLSLRGRWIDRLEKRTIARVLGSIVPRGRVLDLPCGTGRLAMHLAASGYDVTGVDISPEMLAVAQRKALAAGLAIDYRLGNAERLDLPDETFDVAISLRLMGHLPDETKIEVIREMARVSSRGVIVTLYCENPLIRLKKRIKRLVQGRRPVWHPVVLEDFAVLLKREHLVPVQERWFLRGLLEGVCVQLRRD